MKKIIFALFAVAAFAACNNEHTVVTPEGEAIGFANAFVDGTTKAIDPSITTTGDKGIKQFVVYGYTQGKDGDTFLAPVCIFPGVTVNGAVASVDGAGNSTENNATVGWWTYDSLYTQYWIEDNKYKFAAVVNGTDIATKASVTPDTTGLPKSIDYDVKTQNDLLYAVTDIITGKKSGNDDVPFTFNHLLSKAVFTFTNTTLAAPDTGNYYTVESIVIKGLGEVATYDLTGATTPAWTVTAGDYTEQFGNIVETATPTGATAVRVDEQEKFSSNYERLLIPGVYNLTIECVITMWYDNGSTVGKTKVINYSKPLTHEFVQGNAYSFNLTAGLEDQIEFTVVKVDNWIENQKNL